MLKKLVWISVVCIIVMAAVPAFAVQKLPNVVATVNGEKITKEYLLDCLIDWQSKPVLDEIMNNRVIDHEAKKRGVVVTDAQVKTKIAEIRKMRSGGGGQDLDSILESRGITASHFNTIIKGELQMEAILNKKVKVTANDLVGYMRASHILILTSGGPAATDATAKDKEVVDKIDAAEKDIKGGMTFEAAVTKYSEDTGTKVKGGDLGWFKKGRMVAEFDSKVSSMKVGEVSEPVKTQYGYHIIKLTGTSDKLVGTSKKELESMVKRQQIDELRSTLSLEIMNAAKKVNYLEPKKPAQAAKPKPLVHRAPPTVQPAPPAVGPAPGEQPPAPPPAP